MKPRKLIRVYRRLRIRQETLCAIVVNNSQNYIKTTDEMLDEFLSVNKAVDKVIEIMPGIYFFFCEFGIPTRVYKNLKEMGYNCDLDGNEIREKKL